MKAIVASALFIVAGFNSASDDWKKERSLAGFTGLSVSSGIDVYLTQGNAETLTLEARNVDEDRVKSEVRNGTLTLYIDQRGLNGWSMGKNKYVKAYLTFKQLTNLQASGGADVFGQEHFSFQDLSINASGGADVKLDLQANELNVTASGGADATIQGSARKLNAVGSGGADLDARKLVVDSCTASSSGGSDVYVNASKELTMKASGGSDIYYSGSAKILSKSESGGSDITRQK